MSSAFCALTCHITVTRYTQIETHAVVTYSEFVDQNEAILRDIPPPAVAIDYYGAGGERGSDASVESLYDVFSRIRDDESSHVDSMRMCQDPVVRSRARIVEIGAIATAVAVFATSVLTVETVEMEIPVVQQFERRVQQQVTDEIGEVVQKEEADLERFVEKEEANLERFVEKEETDFRLWNVRQQSKGRP